MAEWQAQIPLSTPAPSHSVSPPHDCSLQLSLICGALLINTFPFCTITKTISFRTEYTVWSLASNRNLLVQLLTNFVFGWCIRRARQYRLEPVLRLWFPNKTPHDKKELKFYSSIVFYFSLFLQHSSIIYPNLLGSILFIG